MTRIDLAKRAVGIFVGAGTAVIVKGIIDNNTSPEKLITKINVSVASLVIGAMAREATCNYTDAWIDDLVASWNKIQAKVKEMTTK